MNTGRKGFATLLLLLGAAGGGFLMWLGALLGHGLISVEVDEARPGGAHIHLIVPAILAPLAMDLVPSDLRGDIPPEARAQMAAAIAALNELRKIEDATLVEVDGPREHVQIRVSGGTLKVEVVSDQEHVKVSVPLRALESVMARL